MLKKITKWETEDGKVFDTQEAAEDYMFEQEKEVMTHDAELLPCPFCGATAHFDIDDDNWEWIECGGCGMQGNRSASLMEDCKPRLAEAWNRRTPVVPKDIAKLRAQLEAEWIHLKAMQDACKAMIAAPQPPQVAPLGMPEPAGWRDPTNLLPSQGCTYMRAIHEKWPHIYREALYTEQQVIDLLKSVGGVC